MRLLALLLTLCAAGWADGVRRLTHAQYNNTVRDLLGDQTRPADKFPPEDFVNGYKNQAEAQSISPLLAEAYGKAAERLARNAFRGGDNNPLIPCKPSSPQDGGCAARFVKHFGLRAFRRPLSDKESSRYTELFLREARGGNDFLKGAQIVVEAMLQSPKFLFHLERDPHYGMASRLSYFLWDTMPDEALLRSAAAGELAGADGVEKAARRMLADSRARAAFGEFFAQWLRLDTVLNAVKDRRQYPQFTPELAAAMAEETRLLTDHAAWGDGSFLEIFTADYTFLSSDLAALYKIPAPPAEFAMVKLPADSERAGILGQAAFLAGASKPGDTSPTARGIFVREHLMCQQVPDPPPGTNSNLPLPTKDKPMTNRERLQEHLVNPSCAGCHSLMDPIGLGLERFDAIGRWRDKQVLFLAAYGREQRRAEPTSLELAIDTRGSILGIRNSEFSTPKELGAVLARSAQCHSCIVRQLFRYAMGRKETEQDRAAIQTATEAFRNSGFRFRELVVFLIKSDQFRDRRN